MEKIQLIDPQQFFAETEKVIQIVKERQEDIQRALSAEDRLQLAKKLLEDAKTREEYEQLTKEIKELEFDIKYDKGYVPAIPEEFQMKIGSNRIYEEEKLDVELKKQKEQLFELVEGLESSILTTIKNIELLEERKLIGGKIDILLDEIIHKDGRLHNVMGHANYLGFSGGHSNAKEANADGTKFFKALRKIAKSPNDKLNGIIKPSIFKRILGGK